MTAQHLDTLRTAWRELVASASTVTAWQRGTDAPSVSAPGATPSPHGVPWHTPARWQHLDRLRTAWPDLVASASTVTAWQCGTDAPSVSAPGATPAHTACRGTRLHGGSTSTGCAPPGLSWWPVPAPVTTWRCGTGGPGSVKSAPVDNFYSASILPTAEKMGIVDKVCKWLNSLNNPLNVQKGIHIAQ